jgi:prephenate dehydratase
MGAELVFYRGPKGSSDHRVVRLFTALDGADTHPMVSLWDVLETVDHTPDALGIVPIESSIDGELMSVVDRVLFSTTRLLFAAEAVLSESIAVYAHRADAQPHRVISHPEILQICHGYIAMNGLQSEAADATSVACEIVRARRDPQLVALAPHEVGRAYGLTPLDDDPAGIGEIRTRYLLAAQRVAEPTGCDRTMLAITPPRDAPGVLARILAAFSLHDVNLSSLTSRPLRTNDQSPHYTFVVTCDGHTGDPPVRAAITSVLESGCAVRLLGVYPRGAGPEVCTPFGELPRGSVTSDDAGRVLDPPRVAPVPVR